MLFNALTADFGVDNVGTPRLSTPPAMSFAPPSPSPPELTITEFGLTPSSAVLQVVWPPDSLAADSLLWIHARTNLVAGAWEPIGYMTPGVNAPPLVVEIPFSELPGAEDGMPPSAAFFAVEAQNVADTDRDGVDDLDETGWTELGADMPDFNLDGAVDVVALFDAASDCWWDEWPAVPLPFTVWCGGIPSTNAVATASGVVAFLAAGREDEYLWTSSSNEDFADEYFVYSGDHAVVAACWDDLYVLPGSGAVVRAATFGTEPNRWFVVEYADVTLCDHAWDDDPPCATFHVIASEADPTTVHVRYLAISNGFDFTSATLGAQGPAAIPCLPVACNVADAATNGMVVAYHFGHGSDPHLRDTDGDGLDDGAEVALGTSPRLADTDGDGLPDRWEYDNGLDPLVADRDDEYDGDPDQDGLPNHQEYEYGTDMRNPDTDGDGLPDGAEVGGISVTNVMPWLEFDVGMATDLTSAFHPLWHLANWTLPAPLVVQGVTVTNAVLDVGGAVYFVRAGCEGPQWPPGQSDLSSGRIVQDDTLVVAPYWAWLTLEPELPSRVRVGTSTYDGEGYLLVEYVDVCQDLQEDMTNAVSFQIAIPTNGADRAYVRYRDIKGREMDGREASVGFQSFDGRNGASYCHCEAGRIRDGLALQFYFGTGSDPLLPDTDGDGLSDFNESELGTNLDSCDTDGDGQCPWTDALELACTVANGLTDKKQIMAAITSHLFYNMGFVYETKDGAAKYWNNNHNSFNLMNYLSRKSMRVNCYDQAYGVATFGNLLGVYSTPVFTEPFGYVNTVNLVGVGLCNNPFFTWSDAVYHTPICGADDLSRTSFLNHMYVYAEGEIFDACCGPALGVVVEARYLRNTIDYSTEAECIYSCFAPVGEIKHEFKSRSYRLWEEER